MSKIISGKEISQDLRNKLKKEISELKNKTGKVPGLAVVQVGNVAASSVYVKAKTKSAIEVGIEVIDHHLPEETSEAELLKIVENLNNQNKLYLIAVMKKLLLLFQQQFSRFQNFVKEFVLKKKQMLIK